MDDNARAGSDPGASCEEGPVPGEVRFQRCDWCFSVLLKPRLLCSACGSPDLTWQRSAGLGTVVGSRQIRRKGHSPLTAALVRLDEGFEMEGQVLSATPAIVPEGARVRFGLLGHGASARPVFRLVDGENWWHGLRRSGPGRSPR
ncbi:Zn-ribbon domain-containing OB-fold protein [Streptomyces sp. NPDC005498]|uniref:Zn-ribbon domain-containing OB-fold protein n=1 Tax=Streptomyces sp. NPDC005498 TaxID=3364717 RepID=UPI0036B8DC5F